MSEVAAGIEDCNMSIEASECGYLLLFGLT